MVLLGFYFIAILALMTDVNLSIYFKVLSKRDYDSLIDNVRNGNWLIEYLVNRIRHEELKTILIRLIQPLINLENHERASINLCFLFKLSQKLFQVMCKI